MGVATAGATYSESASASEYTATVLIPIRLAVLKIRHAISPVCVRLWLCVCVCVGGGVREDGGKEGKDELQGKGERERERKGKRPRQAGRQGRQAGNLTSVCYQDFVEQWRLILSDGCGTKAPIPLRSGDRQLRSVRCACVDGRVCDDHVHVW
jgi:hypothetical protein